MEICFGKLRLTVLCIVRSERRQSLATGGGRGRGGGVTEVAGRDGHVDGGSCVKHLSIPRFSFSAQFRGVHGRVCWLSVRGTVSNSRRWGKRVGWGRVGGCVLGWGEQGRMGWAGESERWQSSSTSANSQSYSSHPSMAFFLPGCGWRFHLHCTALRWFRCCMYFVAGILNARFGAGKTSTLVCFHLSGNFPDPTHLGLIWAATKYVQTSPPVTSRCEMASSNGSKEMDFGHLDILSGEDSCYAMVWYAPLCSAPLCYAMLCHALLYPATSPKGQVINSVISTFARENLVSKVEITQKADAGIVLYRRR